MRTRAARAWAVACCLAAAMSSVACQGAGRVQVGAKPFAEQKVLGNLLTEYLQDRGYSTRPVEICDDTYDCQRRLQSGRIDVMVEYSGTAYRLLGERLPEDRGESVERLRELYEPLGIRWSTPLGFENRYVWLMPKDRAITRGIETLADLAEVEGAVRVATPREYVRRSRDGLSATAQRYGIDVESEPLVIDSPIERYRAALDGRVDVVVGYTTDGALETYGMRRLEDNLGFFPPYEATVAVREATVGARPGIDEAIGELEGRIGEEAMQELNYAVEVQGRSPGAVAREFLEERGLVEFASASGSKRSTIGIAVDPRSGLGAFESRAVRAVRTVYEERAVELVETSSPKASVYEGETRLSILSAEKFFERNSPEYVRTERAVALVVLGDRMLHVVRRSGASGNPWSGRIGADRSRASLDFLGEVGAEPKVRGRAEGLLEKLRDGAIDTAVLLVEAGHPAVAEAMDSGRLKLVSLGAGAESRWRFSLPYLRPVRIAEGTYPNQGGLVDTMAAQVLLAGPPGDADPSENAAGPAAGVDRTGHPVSLERVHALAEAVDIEEAPDPALPSLVHVTRADGYGRDEGWFDGEVLDTVLNIGIFVFMGWLVSLVVGAYGEE